MKKEFVFSTKFDTTDFDRSVEQMQKKLKDLAAPINTLGNNTAQRMQQQGIPGMSPQTAEAAARATQQQRREMDQFIAEQARGQEKLGKLIAQRADTLKKLEEQQKNMLKGSAEELKIKEQIFKVEQNTQQLKENYRQRDKVINQALDAQDDAKKRNPPPPPPEPEEPKNRFGAPGLALGTFGKAMGGFGGGLLSVGKVAEQFAGYGQRLEAARGSAIEGTAGTNLRDLYSGRAPIESNFQQERDAAAGLAEQKKNRNRWTDRFMGVGSALMLGGGALMAATGVGTIPGLALMGAGAAGLTNDRNRQGIFGGKEYDQLLAGQQAQDYQNNLNNLKNQDPGKKLAVENLEANRQRNVETQRMLGINNPEFYKANGFLDRTERAGFTDEQGIGMANQIVGAGGSSRMGNEAAFGLQMQRAGLTNASAILGSTSASLQNPEANKRATISIMSEAFKIGLDNTQFAEENRKFTQAAATIIGRTGVTGDSDQERLNAQLSQFMGQKTNQGVSAAVDAYQEFQQRGSQTSGRRGALRFDAAMRDPVLGKLSTSDLTELLSMNPEQQNSSNPAMASFARSAGTTVDDLITRIQGGTDANGQKVKGVNAAGRFVVPGQEKKVMSAADNINKYMEKNNLSFSDIGDMSRKGTLDPSINADLGDMIKEINKSEGGGLTAEQGIARAGEFIKGAGIPGGKEKANAALTGTDRIEDAYNTKAAEGAEEARKNFNQMTEQLWKAVAGADAFTKAIAPLASGLNAAAGANTRALPQGNGYGTDITGTIAPNMSVQTQSNKPKGK